MPAGARQTASGVSATPVYCVPCAVGRQQLGDRKGLEQKADCMWTLRTLGRHTFVCFAALFSSGVVAAAGRESEYATGRAGTGSNAPRSSLDDEPGTGDALLRVVQYERQAPCRVIPLQPLRRSCSALAALEMQHSDHIVQLWLQRARTPRIHGVYGVYLAVCRVQRLWGSATPVLGVAERGRRTSTCH